MEKAIKRAIEGGYINIQGPVENILTYVRHEILLDKDFWSALGKAEGWKGNIGWPQSTNEPIELWLIQWHRFIDHLAEGKDIESFFNTLLK